MVEINNLVLGFVNENGEKFLKKVAKKVLKGENKNKDNLSIVLLSPEKIKFLNKKYRGKNNPTDVLSFGGLAEFPDIPESELGEIAICPRLVEKNAKEFDSDYYKELARVLIHGILHLLGYSHEESKEKAKKMEKKEKHYLSFVK